MFFFNGVFFKCGIFSWCFRSRNLTLEMVPFFRADGPYIGAPEMLCNSTFGFDRFERSDIKERRIWHCRGWVFFLLLTT